MDQPGFEMASRPAASPENEIREALSLMYSGAIVSRGKLALYIYQMGEDGAYGYMTTHFAPQFYALFQLTWYRFKAEIQKAHEELAKKIKTLDKQGRTSNYEVSPTQALDLFDEYADLVNQHEIIFKK